MLQAQNLPGPRKLQGWIQKILEGEAGKLASDLDLSIIPYFSYEWKRG